MKNEGTTDIQREIIVALAHYKPKQVQTVLTLLAEGNTVPFIARYRKEMTGSLDEVQIREIEERSQYIENLSKRKQEIKHRLVELEKLTPELAHAIDQATKLQLVEDLYRPYKQKRRTKATIAKERGLEPLANWVLTFPTMPSFQEKARSFLSEELLTIEEVQQGVHEILAEQISDRADFRRWLRHYTLTNGRYVSEVKDKEKDEKGTYEMYYDFSEPLSKMISHRVLATNRGEKEGILKISLGVDPSAINQFLAKNLLGEKTGEAVKLIESAYQDAYKRFIAPAIEREIRAELTEKADEQAIHIFGENLRNLLLQSPLKGKTILGFDPAYRTGCKLAIMDATGSVLAIDVIYPHAPASAAKRAESGPKFRELVTRYHVDMVAIGNGTASRESEQFVAEQLKNIPQDVFYVIVNEAGASVYSASQIARDEFPDLQVEQRSAVSIGRRLQDPLAELVKIEPKAVGVGQYQHDVAQKKLEQQLTFVVETAVNQVGVDVNTASPQLLAYIAGLNKTTAQNIVNYRQEIGGYTERKQLKKVPRLGPKAYEQAIGFLRIPQGTQPLDTTSIHPESYDVARELLKEAKVTEKQLGSEVAYQKLTELKISEVAKQLGVGVLTVTDIMSSLVKPGRDMREEMPAPLLRKDVLTIDDLVEGMALKGTVRNVVDFGAFVDIGVKHDGLVHLSKLSHKFVRHPREIVAVGDIVDVWIEQVDRKRERVSLTMVAPEMKTTEG